MRTILLASLMLGACGGGDDGMQQPRPDAEPSSVVEVTCSAGNIDATVTTGNFVYMPEDTTIAVGDIVHFTPAGAHDVQGDGFSVGFGGDKCFQFTEAGTFGIECSLHHFTGSIIVQ